MVVESRYAQHVSERKMDEAKNALKGVEEAISVVQQQVQLLRRTTIYDLFPLSRHLVLVSFTNDRFALVLCSHRYC